MNANQALKYADSLIAEFDAFLSERKLLLKEGRIEIYEISLNGKIHYEIIFFEKVIKRYRKRSSVEKWIKENFKKEIEF